MSAHTLPPPRHPLHGTQARVEAIGDSSKLYKNGLLTRLACDIGGQRLLSARQDTFSELDCPRFSLRAELLMLAPAGTDREALAAICTASRLDRSILLDSPLAGPDLHSDVLARHLPLLTAAHIETQDGLPLVLRHLHPQLQPALCTQLANQGWQMAAAGAMHAANATELHTSNNLYLRHDLTLSNDDCQLLGKTLLDEDDLARLHWLSSQSQIKSMRQYLPGFLDYCMQDADCQVYALRLGRKLVAMMITRRAANLVSLLALACDPTLSPAYAAERRLLARMYLDALESDATLLYPLELANYCRLRGIGTLPMQHAFLLNHLPARQRLAAAGLLDYLRQQAATPTARSAGK